MLAADGPPTVTTVTSMVAPGSAGEVTESEVSVQLVGAAAATEPKSTALTLQAVVPPKKPVPVMVTGVPPAVGPRVTESAVTVGGTA